MTASPTMHGHYIVARVCVDAFFASVKIRRQKELQGHQINEGLVRKGKRRTQLRRGKAPYSAAPYSARQRSL